MQAFYLVLQLSLVCGISSINRGGIVSNKAKSDNKFKPSSLKKLSNNGIMDLNECFTNASSIGSDDVERKTCNDLLYKQYVSTYMQPNPSVVHKDGKTVSDSAIQTLVQSVMDALNLSRNDQTDINIQTLLDKFTFVEKSSKKFMKKPIMYQTSIL